MHVSRFAQTDHRAKGRIVIVAAVAVMAIVPIVLMLVFDKEIKDLVDAPVATAEAAAAATNAALPLPAETDVSTATLMPTATPMPPPSADIRRVGYVSDAGKGFVGDPVYLFASTNRDFDVEWEFVPSTTIVPLNDYNSFISWEPHKGGEVFVRAYAAEEGKRVFLAKISVLIEAMPSDKETGLQLIRVEAIEARPPGIGGGEEKKPALIPGMEVQVLYANGLESVIKDSSTNGAESRLGYWETLLVAPESYTFRVSAGGYQPKAVTRAITLLAEPNNRTTPDLVPVELWPEPTATPLPPTATPVPEPAIRSLSPADGWRFYQVPVDLRWEPNLDRLPQDLVYRVKADWKEGPRRPSEKQRLDVLSYGTEWLGWWPIYDGKYTWTVEIVQADDKDQVVSPATTPRAFYYEAPPAKSTGGSREPTPVPRPD